MDNVLVTGGAGYIGSHTCKLLSEAGLVPITYDNLVHGHAWAVKWGPLVKGDLGDSNLLTRVFREYQIKAVIHFAAYAYVEESMRQPERYFRNNVVNTLNLLQTMRSVGVGHIVFSSTCATYGLPQAVPIREDHVQNPINPYGDSKRFVECALDWYGRAYGLKSVALRYFNAAGADPDGDIGEDHDPETHLIPLVIQATLGQRACVQVYGTDYDTPDGTAIRDYIHVTDLADAHVRALAHILDGGESVSLNLGVGRGYSVREVIAAVERVSASSVPTRDAPRRPGDPPELVADPACAKRVLGWQPRYSSIETIVQTAWNWHQRLTDGRDSAISVEA